MNYLWKIVRTVMAIVGCFIVYGAVGTSDFYVIELNQPEPSNVWTNILIGLLMTVPAVIHAVREYLASEKQ